MGVVYRAIDPTIGRTVALKTTRLDVDAIERDELLRRFRNEAHAAGQMNHPNIVTIHDAGECDGLFYIAMEYLEGETLQYLMTQTHPLPTDQIIEIARQIATGLDYAHSMSVVHRDIKPTQHHDHTAEAGEDHGFWYFQIGRHPHANRAGLRHCLLHVA